MKDFYKINKHLLQGAEVFNKMNPVSSPAASSGQNVSPPQSHDRELSAVAKAYGLPVAVVKGIQTVISAVACGNLTRKNTYPFHWQYRTTQRQCLSAITKNVYELAKFLSQRIKQHSLKCQAYKAVLSPLERQNREGLVELKDADKHLSDVFKLVQAIYTIDHKLNDKCSKTPETNLFNMNLAREIITRLGQDLDFCNDLLNSWKNCIEALMHGNIPDQPRALGMIIKYLETLRDNEAKNKMLPLGVEKLVPPPFTLSVGRVPLPEHFFASGRTFAEVYCIDIASPPSDFFWRLRELQDTVNDLIHLKFGVHFQLNKDIARKLDLLFRQHRVNHVLDVFSGIGLFQAAMKSVGSPLRVTSLDNFSDIPGFRPTTGNSRSFFPAYDDTGVLFVDDSFQFLYGNSHLIQKDACLLLAYPTPDHKCLRALRSMLRLWATFNGGMVILLSDAADDELLYGDLFTSGSSYQKIDARHVQLPVELVRSMPHAPPRIFYVKSKKTGFT